MTYRVQLLPKAKRELMRLPRKDQVRVLALLSVLATEPRPAGVVKLAGQNNLWRLRTGNYRIVYEIHDDRLIVLVLRIGHRRDVYRGV